MKTLLWRERSPAPMLTSAGRRLQVFFAAASRQQNMPRRGRITGTKAILVHYTSSRNRDVLQLSGLLAGDVKESRNDSPTRDLQMAADRTRPHTLCGPVVSSLFSVAARC
jgi:hypothetical protein